MRRNSWIAVGLACLFGLLSDDSVGEVSVLGITLTDLPFIRIIIPALVAGLMLRTLMISNERQLALDGYWAICKARFPLMWESGFLELTVPSGSPLSTGPDAMTSGTKYWRIQRAVESTETVALPLLFALRLRSALYVLWRRQT
jgi:hypothetical protein